MIKIVDLHKSFDGSEVIRGISFEIKKGEVVALIGGSGGGKSVILKHIAGLLKPTSGSIYVDGKDMNKLKGKRLISLRSRMGFLFQDGALFDSLTVYENVEFPLKEGAKLSPEIIKARVGEELAHVGLSNAENKYPSQISGGMVKRTALARALAREPEIMLFDEPTTGLDPVIGLSILNLIHSCHQRLAFTGIIVTHEIQRVFNIVDRVIMINQGIVWAEGKPEDLASTKDPTVRRFIDSTNEACLMDNGNKNIDVV